MIDDKNPRRMNPKGIGLIYISIYKVHIGIYREYITVGFCRV